MALAWYIVLPLCAAVLTCTIGRRVLQRGVPVTVWGWLLALAPAVLLFDVVRRLGVVTKTPWQEPLPGLAWGVGPAWMYLDALSALFVMLVTGVGALALVYAGYYFKGDAGAWRFLTYLLLFMTAMLGVVLAGDAITLFVFWEATSITSFLLIGYKMSDPEARRGALQSLIVTGAGGVALLAGLAAWSAVAGGVDWATLWAAPVREHPWYLVVLALVTLGAVTKSVQVPFHFWLPGAMTAPTPASAYLHSATMVKAGVYLLARVHPGLGGTDAWFWVLSAFGCVTMVTGAWMGLRQYDLKALLAYSTVSQLGGLVLLLGQDSPMAAKAVVVALAAHALYKSALFLVAGIVDHETGTRDLRRLSHMARAMPATCTVATLAALSMAGLPPMFGFLAKETLLAAAVHPNIPYVVAPVLTAAAVLTGALIFVQAGLFVWEVFFDPPQDPTVTGHEAPWGMWLMPGIPAVVSLCLGLLPEPEWLAKLLAAAAETAAGQPVKVSLALWTGLNIPLGLSLLALTLGTTALVTHRRWRPILERSEGVLACRRLYDFGLHAMDRAAWWVTRVQQGRLRYYLLVMLAATLGLVLWQGGLTGDVFMRWRIESMTGSQLLTLIALAVALVTTLATVLLRRAMLAVLALGGSGLAVAMLFALYPAPDVALVQVVVDILTVVFLVLALRQLGRPASTPVEAAGRWGALRDVTVALALGAVVMWMTAVMLATRPRPSQVTPFYEANAKPLTGARDVVGAILVDFRSLDTWIEIAVFGMAGLAVWTLLVWKLKETARALPAETSPLMRALATAIVPLTLVIGLVQVLYGHDQPGDGFSAGIIISLGIGYMWVVFGPIETRRRLPWVRPLRMVGTGLLLVTVSGAIGWIWGGAWLAPVNLNRWITLPLPSAMTLSTSLLFELAICVTVVGGATAMLWALAGGEQVEEENVT